jgi:hypothetical protein
MKNKEVFITFTLFLICATLLFYMPLLIIWALNNLFNLDAPYNWKTWVSVYILFALVNSMISKNESCVKVKDFWR